MRRQPTTKDETRMKNRLVDFSKPASSYSDIYVTTDFKSTCVNDDDDDDVDERQPMMRQLTTENQTQTRPG